MYQMHPRLARLWKPTAFSRVKVNTQSLSNQVTYLLWWW